LGPSVGIARNDIGRSAQQFFIRRVTAGGREIASDRAGRFGDALKVSFAIFQRHLTFSPELPS
jgi:hypothetical protein